MVLIEAVYLEKLCGVIYPGSAWILYALMKENKEWEMPVFCKFHTLAVCGRGSLRAQGGFTVFMNQKSRTICSVLKNVVFFLFPPCSPIFCRLSFQLGTVTCSEYLNIVDWGGSGGVCALLDVKLYFNAGFCVGSWMQNSKNTVQLEMTMNIVKCLNVKHWMKKTEFQLM